MNCTESQVGTFPKEKYNQVKCNITTPRLVKYPELHQERNGQQDEGAYKQEGDQLLIQSDSDRIRENSF